MSVAPHADHSEPTPSTPPASLPAVAPYRRGDRISVISPEGIRFVAKVDSVTAEAAGQFTVLAAIREPRRYRNHLLTTVVDACGVTSPVASGF